MQGIACRKALLAAIALVPIHLTTFAADAGSADEIVIQAGLFGSDKALLMAPAGAKALAILLPGGNGSLELKDSSGVAIMGQLQFNFLVRARGEFVKRGLAVLAIDTPGSRPMTYMERSSSVRHIPTLYGKAVERVPALKGLPVWGVGTSAGTITLAALVGQQPALLDGAIFTAPVTSNVSGGLWGAAFAKGVASMPGLGKFTKPVLVMAVANDQCIETPPKDADMLRSAFTASPRTQAIVADEGGSPNGSPCEAHSPHGFWDIEDQAVDAMAKFILQ